MKKILLTIAVILITMSTVAFGQYTPNYEPIPPSNALYLTGGYSQITGFVGGELQLKKVGLEFGGATWSSPLNGEKATAIGGGISFYSDVFDKPSAYLTLGYMANGAVIDYQDSWGNHATKWGDPLTIMLGWKFAGDGPLMCKLGVGYMSCEIMKGFTFEAKLGLRLAKF